MKKRVKKYAYKIALASALTGVLGTIGTQVSTPIIVRANVEEDTVSMDVPDLILTEEEIELANQYIQEQRDNMFLISQNINSRSTLAGGLLGWAGTFLIPGVGQVVVTAAGAIIVGGVAVSVGSWLGQKVKNWIYESKKSDAEKASNSIPSSLKKNKDHVDLGKFTEKVRGSSKKKDPKTGWMIDPDKVGHKGYDGTEKKWKILNKKGNRVGSLNAKGKIIDK